MTLWEVPWRIGVQRLTGLRSSQLGERLQVRKYQWCFEGNRAVVGRQSPHELWALCTFCLEWFQGDVAYWSCLVQVYRASPAQMQERKASSSLLKTPAIWGKLCGKV